MHAIEQADVMIAADYGNGFLTQRPADRISAKARERGALLTADPPPHTSLASRRAAAIKPNRSEAFLAAGLAPSEPTDPPTTDLALLEAGNRLLGLCETQPPHYPGGARHAAVRSTGKA